MYGGGSTDGFLAVFQPMVTGTTAHLKYCTYLGIYAQATVTGSGSGFGGERLPRRIYVGSHRHAAHDQRLQTAYAGDPSDGFVMKILPSGNGVADLSYGTYLGGGGMDQALAIAVGTQLPGTAYVTGITQSVNFPGATNISGPIAGYQTALQGQANAFLAVIGQNGAGVTSLLYSTYLGGIQNDVGLSVWFAQENQVYISGSTTSAQFPAQFNFQPFSGDQDIFVAELDRLRRAAHR